MDTPWTVTEPWRQWPAAMLYQENSVLNPAREPALREGIMAFSEGIATGAGADASAGKSYPLCPRVALPRRGGLVSSTERLIRKRRTRRTFTGKGISAGQLARILRSACGITSPGGDGADGRPLRAYPSAGALYPLEVYPVVLRAADLPCGVYHYHVQGHCLERLTEGDFRDRLEANLLGGEPAGGADAALLITSVLRRTMDKYGERGYRFILIEVGHLAQNVSLVCEALGLNSVCIGGFYEAGLAGLLDTDVRREPVQYVIALGTR